MGEDPVLPGDDDTTPEPRLRAVPTDPTELVGFLEERRARLGATVDELVARVTPGEMVRRVRNRLRARIRLTTHTPDGGVRWERIAAVSSAATILLTSVAFVARRRLH
jgi:hypothetical protein